MFGDVVKHHAAQELVGRPLTQHIIEALSKMGVEVVQFQVNSTCRGIRTSEQFINERDEIGFSTTRGDRDYPRSDLRFKRKKHVVRAFAHVLVVYLGGSVRRHGHWLAAAADQLQALLVDADHRLAARQKSRLQLKQLIHALAVLIAQRADAPHQPAPGPVIV